MKFTIVIPARYDSSRLPGKALLPIAGKSMLQHVYERAQQAGAARIIVATDDVRIEQAATQFGAEVCMTQKAHDSGTERIVEVVKKLAYADDDIIVNVQGDEPLIPVATIKQVAEDLGSQQLAAMSTLCSALRDPEELFNRNIVKVVRDKDNYALYFSRATIPWSRDAFMECEQGKKVDLTLYHRHIGLYAYRVGFLKRYIEWARSPLEELERLEQLRVLWYGEKIHVADAVEISPQDVNTQEDLLKIRKLLES